MKPFFIPLISLMYLVCSLTLQAKTPGAVISYKVLGKHVFYLKTSRHIDYRITFYRDDVVRIQAAPRGRFKDPKNNPKKAQILVVDSPSKVDVLVKNGKQTIEWKTSKIQLTLNKKTCCFSLARIDGGMIWKEVKPLDFNKTRTVQSLSTSPDEQFFGGGLQKGTVSHKGRKIKIRDDGNSDKRGEFNPAPFYVSSLGYGVLRNTFSPGLYDFTNPQWILLDHAELRFDAFYFIGNNFKQVVDLYTQFTGRPNFIPIWGLEMGEADAYLILNKKIKKSPEGKSENVNEKNPSNILEQVAKQYRKNDMPSGWVFLQDNRTGSEASLFPNVVNELSQLGFYTGLWTKNDIKKLRGNVGETGIRAQKLDLPWKGSSYQFSLEANKQAWRSLTKNTDRRAFVWTVQGWAGIQRYSICWTGDQYGSWDFIRYHIPTMIGSGMSGQVYVTSDIDGIFGGSPESYTRDLQWKCFTPVLYAVNGWAGKMSKSPWAFKEPFISINRKYLKLKLRLTPYMYKYVREAYDTGAPIVRGMFWEFPNDKKMYKPKWQYQYMLGESFLVAPVFTSQKINKGWRKKDIYLPKGEWIDYWDGRRLHGPLVIDAYPSPLTRLPLLVKAGAIIPMYPEMLYNNQKPKDPLTFDIYPHGESEFELYEDDGLTQKYQSEFAKQRITVLAPQITKAGDVTIRLEPPHGTFNGQLKKRIYQFYVHLEVKPKGVTFQGEDLKEVNDAEALRISDAGWYYAAKEKRGIVYIKLKRMDVNQPVELKLLVDKSAKIKPSPAYPQPEITSEIDKTQLKVTASSENVHTPIANAFDGSNKTIWHSEYKENKSVGRFPYDIDIELGGLFPINGVNYLPRQKGENGLLKDYEIYVSRSKDSFGEPVAKGSFSPGIKLKKISFKSKWGEYIKLRFLNAQDVSGKVVNTSFASAAEFAISQDFKAPRLKDKTCYLTELTPASSKGEFKKDLSYGGKGLVVNGQAFARGIGALSGSEIVYKLDGSWDKLKGYVGVDDEVGDAGSVKFCVYADGKLLFESPKQTGKSLKQLLELNIKGVNELKLVLLDLGDGSKDDHGDWLDIHLIQQGSR